LFSESTDRKFSVFFSFADALSKTLEVCLGGLVSQFLIKYLFIHSFITSYNFYANAKSNKSCDDQIFHFLPAKFKLAKLLLQG